MRKLLTPIKAIRAKCLDCCCQDRKEVRECVIENCPLYPYRMGKRPKEGTATHKTTKEPKPQGSQSKTD